MVFNRLNRWSRTILFTTIALIFITIFLFSIRTFSPEYQGKSAMHCLDSENSTNSISAFRTMGKTAVPFLIRVVEEKPSRLSRLADRLKIKFISGEFRIQSHRQTAAFILGEMGPEASEAIPSLLQILTDSSEESRIKDEAVHSLLQMCDLGAHVPVFLALLNSTDPQSRIRGIHLPTAAGTKARAAVPALQKFGDNSDSVPIARALWSIDRQTNLALQILTKALHSESETTQMRALVNLGEMGGLRGTSQFRSRCKRGCPGSD